LITIREEGESAVETPSRDSLIRTASTYLGGRYPTPVTVRIPANSEINVDGVFTIDNLIPGMRIPLRASLTCREIVQEQKLDRMTVSETASGGEVIHVSMSPSPGTTVFDGETGSDLS